MAKKIITFVLLFAFIWFVAPDMIPGIIDDIALVAGAALTAGIVGIIDSIISAKRISNNT